MNKIIFYFFLFTSVFSIAQSKELSFELKHYPNSEYLSQFEKITKFKIVKKADKETLKYFDSVGVKRVLKGNKKETHSLLTKTKEETENETIPIEILAYNFDFKGTLNKEKVDKTVEFSSIQAKGYVDFQNNLTINELLVDNKRSKDENELIRIIENKENLIAFPKHKIGIGEAISFEHVINYSIIYEGDNHYRVKCLATLTNIKNDIAHFKISSEKPSETQNYNLTVIGILKFDIKNNFANYMCLESILNIDEVIDDGIIFEHTYSEKKKTTTKFKNTSW
ncbi:hypothetical protein [uncultured Psychroserpens sp.]|uniref:hypothetical protein n=1 Tax=uncultured Psychroserpens sp. TaxID=255436 RepID=UPI0026379F2A|nr:hypothetical protein [uncultured Psychroserpens sp.]